MEKVWVFHCPETGGSSPDAVELKALAQNLGVERDVVFLGYQANPQPSYQMMNVFSIASAWDVNALYKRLLARRNLL